MKKSKKCGECIHYDICAPYVSPNESFPEVGDGCGLFKDKSLNIELPCKVGTTVFTIKNDCIEQERVSGIKIGNCGILLQISNNNDGFDFYYDVEVGRRLFFEQEKAEKALARMKGGE